MIATKFLSKLFGKKPKNTVDMWRFPIERQIKQKQNLSKNFKNPNSQMQKPLSWSLWAEFIWVAYVTGGG